MSKLRVRNFFKKNKFERAKSTTDLREWTKSDDKLMTAVEHEDLKKVTTLLSKKSLVPTKLGPLGRSVFHIACALGNDPILDLLLKVTEDVNDPTIQGNTALQLSAAKGHTYTVHRLLKVNADVNQCDSNDMTALHHACAGHHLECIQVLLAGNANPHAKEKGGKTSLFYSAHRGNEDTCKCLLDNGADINCQDTLHVTPLMIAAKEGHRIVCEFLLRRGADPSIADREGHTALHYATAAGHPELHEVFERAPKQAFSEGSVEGSPQPSESGSRMNDPIASTIHDSVHQLHTTPVTASTSDDESHGDIHSIHSVDDRLLSKPQLSSPELVSSIASAVPDVNTTTAAHTRTEKALKELKEEHEQLNDEYSTLSIENLRLRDKLYDWQTKMTSGQQQDSVTISKEIQEEIRSLKVQLEEEKEKVKALEAHGETSVKQVMVDNENPNLSKVDNSKNTSVNNKTVASAGNWSDRDEEDSLGKMKSENSSSLSETQLVAMLRSQILSLRNENDQLKAAVLQGVSEDQLLSGAVAQKELFDEIESQVKTLTLKVSVLEEELERAKAEVPSDAQRLNALLEQSKEFEEVTFDDDGFVNGRDMTKEEFLQSQNQQLRTHCGLLSEELEKLRGTLDAILKAGDNLQADYDQQTVEKESLQDDLEVAVKEKSEMVSENEFLLSDNNTLHEDLNKLVYELEKMQEQFQAVQVENEELRRSVGVASKVGEVARLLETRDHLQYKCDEYEETITRLQHDHGILIEEIQSLNESVVQLTSERDQLTSDLEMTDSIYQQLDTLQQEHHQLESDFSILAKESLERNLPDSNLSSPITTAETTVAPSTGSDSLLQQVLAEKENIETIDKELRQEISGLIEKVKHLELQLEQTRANSKTDQPDSNHNNNNSEQTNGEDKYDTNEEVVALLKQIARLNHEIGDWERRHDDTVSTYRTHLLSAVQGHMDPDVKDALYHIIELRSMEQFC